jgi:hypothetical protein
MDRETESDTYKEINIEKTQAYRNRGEDIDSEAGT